MKKLLLLPLLFNASCALAHDETAQHHAELTEKQKKILSKIFNAALPEAELPLKNGCGLIRDSQADSYNPEQYPHCAKVLDFLTRSYQQMKQLDREGLGLYYATGCHGDSTRTNL